MAKKIRRGRPKLPKGVSRASVVTLRLQASERKAIDAAATRDGFDTISEWIRAALMAVCEPITMKGQEGKVEESNPSVGDATVPGNVKSC